MGPDHRLTPVPAVGSRLFLGLEQADVGRRPVRRPESNRCQRYRTSCFMDQTPIWHTGLLRRPVLLCLSLPKLVLYQTSKSL